METPSFTQDLFDTYQSLPPYLQILWLVVPPIFTTVMFSLWLRYRLARAELGSPAPTSEDAHGPQFYWPSEDAFECYVAGAAINSPVNSTKQKALGKSEKDTSKDEE